MSWALWRTRLREAQFKGAPFHTDTAGRASGTRVVLHEYPKRNVPYAESMGRQAIRYQMTGYLIQKASYSSGLDGGLWRPMQLPSGSDMQRDYDLARDTLINALEDPQPGILRDPYNHRFWGGMPGPIFMMCERYSVTETRERGGYAQFEMSFVEAGISALGGLVQDTANQAQDAADAATAAAATQLNQQQTDIITGPTVPTLPPAWFFPPSQ
jgi:prophage DNA circulation protein